MAVPGGKEEGEEEGNDGSGGPQPPHKGWGGGLGCMPRRSRAAGHPAAPRWHRYCHPLSPPRGQLRVGTGATVLPLCWERCGVTRGVHWGCCEVATGVSTGKQCWWLCW